MLDARVSNSNLPTGVYLVAGDPSLEIQAQVINQISGQALPTDSWKNVHRWLADLVDECCDKLGAEFTTVFVDCNPSGANATDGTVRDCVSAGFDRFARVPNVRFSPLASLHIPNYRW
jgi:chromosome partitioning protein